MLPGSLAETEREIEAAGGTCIPIRCDHSVDAEVHGLFEAIAERGGNLDLLVNAAWGGYETMFSADGTYVWNNKFWDQPLAQWDTMFDAGVRAAWVTSHHAARMMAARRRGVIINLSHWAAQAYAGNVCYGVAKAATDKLTAYCAQDLREFGVAVFSLYPGIVRTERVMFAASHLDLSNSESPEFQGRVIAALIASEGLMDRSGSVLVSASIAEELGVVDVDGRQPVPLTLEEAT